MQCLKMKLRLILITPPRFCARSWCQPNLTRKLHLAMFQRSRPIVKRHEILFLRVTSLSQTTSSRSVSWLYVISTSPPVLAMQQTMQQFHETTHFPWWVTIVLTTCAIRLLLTFPLTIYQNYIIAKYAAIQPEIVDIVKELKMETAVAIRRFGWDQKKAKQAYVNSLRKQIRLLVERDNCHPMKASLVLWIQIPAWFSVSFGLRNLCSSMPNLDLDAHIAFLEMCEGGLLWIPNLTFPDTSFLFPLCFGLLNLAIIEIHSLRTLKHTRFQKILTNVFRGFAVLMIPVSATVPSCLVLYWTTSSIFGLSQNLLLMSPQFRRLCRIPDIAGESVTPYQDLIDNFKSRFRSSK